MRRLLPCLLFVPVAVAAACATTSPILESTGGNPDPTCSSCIEVSCCSPAQDCAGDDSCLACLGQADPSEDCIVDTTFGALEACLADRCAGMCTTGGTSSGTSGGGGGNGGSPSSSGTTSSPGGVDPSDTYPLACGGP